MKNILQIKWYGAKTVYLHKVGEVKTYEERIVLIRAGSFDDAIQKAEDEALEYILGDGKIQVLDYINVFELSDEEIEDKTEVFSLLRDSDLNPNNYINTYLDISKERTQK